ncbi:hypothetical protein [Saccharicrinis sp. GN24d3]|uniref:hypothetical protein n=1 Tax=Saccharicrinis sp. GN24d3 TaxID=3458416 RepID=UPI0040360C5B
MKALKFKSRLILLSIGIVWCLLGITTSTFFLLNTIDSIATLKNKIVKPEAINATRYETGSFKENENKLNDRILSDIHKSIRLIHDLKFSRSTGYNSRLSIELDRLAEHFLTLEKIEKEELSAVQEQVRQRTRKVEQLIKLNIQHNRISAGILIAFIFFLLSFLGVLLYSGYLQMYKLVQDKYTSTQEENVTSKPCQRSTINSLMEHQAFVESYHNRYHIQNMRDHFQLPYG